MQLDFCIYYSYIITMSYKVRQKVGNNIYLYEVTAYWDTKLKQPRQKRVILGKIDPKTGKLIPSKNRAQIRNCRDFGAFHLCQHASQETGLSSILEKSFPEHWKDILTCAFFDVIERKPLYLCEPWTLSSQTIADTTLTSQRISELLKDIAGMDREQMTFFHQWTRHRSEREYLAFDITSISSYSKLMEYLEFGYNRDGEDMPQVNMGILFGQSSLLPVFYRINQGSVRDMSTLDNMMEYARQFDMEKISCIMDKGFYSDQNMASMLKKGVLFIISVPFTTSLARDLVAKSRQKIGQPAKTILVNGDMLNVEKRETTLHGKKIQCHVYFNEHHHLDAKAALMKQIVRLEKYLEGRRSVPPSLSNPYLKYLKIRRTRGKLKIRRDEEKIIKSLLNRGWNVLLSNDMTNSEDALQLYRAKDAVEKAFDNIKNELDLKRLRVHSDDAMNGRIFIGFIALVLLSWLDKKMKDKKLYKNYTQEEVMWELKRLKIVELGEKRILTEISKKQFELFKQLEIPLPKA